MLEDWHQVTPRRYNSEIGSGIKLVMFRKISWVSPAIPRH